MPNSDLPSDTGAGTPDTEPRSHLRVINGGEQEAVELPDEPLPAALPGEPEQTSVDGRIAVDGCIIPEGYEVWKNGVWQTIKPDKPDGKNPDTIDPHVARVLPAAMRGRRKQISPLPLWLAEHAVREDGSTVMRIGGRSAANSAPLTGAWITRDDMIHARKITAALGKYEAAVCSEIAGPLTRYFMACEVENEGHIKKTCVATRSGYHALPTGAGWLLGRKWTGPGKVSYDPTGENSFAAALVTRGTRERWMDMYRRVRADGTAARMTLAAAFAAPLVRLFRQQSFWFFLCGKSQSGKTAFVQFAMSIYGNPERLTQTFNATQNGILAPLRECTDLPLHIDELESAREDLSLKKVIYDSCNGVERSRATKTGGAQQRATWTTLVLANGEHNLIETTDLEGVRSRVLSYVIEKTSERTAFTAEMHEFMKSVGSSYGWVGLEWLKTLSTIANDPTALQELRLSLEKFREDVRTAIGEDKRLLSKITLLAFASYATAHALLRMDRDVARAEALADAKTMYERLPSLYHDQYANQGMEALTAYFNNPRNQDIWGCSEGALLLAESANKALVAARLIPERVWSDFKERGWVVTEHGRTKIQRPIKGGALRAVYLIPNKIWTNGGDPAENETPLSAVANDVELPYEQRMASQAALESLGAPGIGMPDNA